MSRPTRSLPLWKEEVSFRSADEHHVMRRQLGKIGDVQHQAAKQFGARGQFEQLATHIGMRNDRLRVAGFAALTPLARIGERHVRRGTCDAQAHCADRQAHLRDHYEHLRQPASFGADHPALGAFEAQRARR